MSDADLAAWTDTALAAAYAGLFGDARTLPGFDPGDQALILVGLQAVHGDEGEVVRQGRRALAAGAPARAVVEVVLAAAISRGGQALRRAGPLLAELRPTPRVTDDPDPPSARAYFTGEFGEVPIWARRLEEFDPEALAAYAAIRRRILTDGAAPRRIKELLTMVLNAIDGNAGGVRSHASAAVRHGADRASVLGALLLGVRVGGIVTWINGIGAVGDAMGEPSRG